VPSRSRGIVLKEGCPTAHPRALNDSGDSYVADASSRERIPKHAHFVLNRHLS